MSIPFDPTAADAPPCPRVAAEPGVRAVGVESVGARDELAGAEGADNHVLWLTDRIHVMAFAMAIHIGARQADQGK